MTSQVFPRPLRLVILVAGKDSLSSLLFESLLFVNEFYGRQRDGTSSLPMRITIACGEPFAFAYQ